MPDGGQGSMLSRLRSALAWSLDARARVALAVLPRLRGLLWVIALMLALPAIELLGISRSSFVPERIASSIGQTVRLEYLVLVMLLGLGVLHIRETLLHLVWQAGGKLDELEPQPSDGGWIFWAAAFSAVLIATVLKLAPQNLEQNMLLTGDELVWRGAIANQERDVMAAISRGSIRTVRLQNNNGGSPEIAGRVAQALRAHGVLKVVADGTCASACAHLWLLSENRVLAPFSVLGFHQGRARRFAGLGAAPTTDADASAMLNSALLDALIGAGGDPALSAKLLSADNGAMHWVSAADLKALGVRFTIEDRP